MLEFLRTENGYRFWTELFVFEKEKVFHEFYLEMLKSTSGNFIFNTNLPNAPFPQFFPPLFPHNSPLVPLRPEWFLTPPLVSLKINGNKSPEFPEENIPAELSQTHQENMGINSEKSSQRGIILHENEKNSDISYVDIEGFLSDNIALDALGNNNLSGEIGLERIEGVSKTDQIAPGGPEKTLISEQKENFRTFPFLKL